MVYINEVRERLAHDIALVDDDYPRVWSDDVRAILADHALLQAENERLKAERVDLEQFRDAVFFWISETEKLHDTPPKRGLEVYGNRLLALIDAHKGE